ncbi:MAG: cupin domain-containing protein [Desulfococcaceae bacterium]
MTVTESPRRISSGVSHLDRLLGGLFIGDNVVWYDDAGSLAGAFCINFIRECRRAEKPVLYVSFDRSPKNLLEKLGGLAVYPGLTILDCFTDGKGDGSEVFERFYENGASDAEIVRVRDPRSPDAVMAAVYERHRHLAGDVRLIFESLTGMQDLWDGEDSTLKFYTHSCPRLYEMNTVAYWVAEKAAHSARLRAHINQIAQVAVALSIKRGKSAITILKAEGRNPDTLNQPTPYWSDGAAVTFDRETRRELTVDLGRRLKTLRTRRGLSQTELARLVGVTPSTISQVESNQIFPSLTAMFKMAEILEVEPAAFLQSPEGARRQVIFSEEDGGAVAFPDLPSGGIAGKRLIPPGVEGQVEPYKLEIPAGKTLSAHFFRHRGEEMGYLLSGKLVVEIEGRDYPVSPGDLVYLTRDMPERWRNAGEEPAVLLWFTVR